MVILGAGASIASAIRNREPGGKALPSMDNLVEVVGLDDVIEMLPAGIRSGNFEEMYSRLHQIDPDCHAIQEMENRVSHYFSGMHLPPEPTIYDYLILSMRPKDLVATFNWDPFLYDACRRNHTRTDLPRVVYLHGNVRIGFCLQDAQKGLVGTRCSRCARPFAPSNLLFPVEQKNYADDPYISGEWSSLRHALQSASVVTIFGFSAPETDVEAVRLLSEAWGTPDERNLEQIEIINIESEEKVRHRWGRFIHSHHYDYCTSYFDSRLAYFPRRSVESYVHQFHPSTPEEMLQEPNPVPGNFGTLDEMWAWLHPIVVAEAQASDVDIRRLGQLRGSPKTE